MDRSCQCKLATYQGKASHLVERYLTERVICPESKVAHYHPAGPQSTATPASDMVLRTESGESCQLREEQDDCNVVWST